MSSIINNYNSSQMDTLLKSMDKSNTQSGKVDIFKNEISNNTKKDFLDLSSQIDIINKENSKVTKSYTELETKLGIDSSKWGVEAVSDNIFNFAKIVYERYKLDHSEEEAEEMLDKFYDLAKNSITKGYNEAIGSLGTLTNDVQELSKATFDRSLEKLEAWYNNGGKDVIEELNTDNTEKNSEIKNQSVSNKNNSLSVEINKQLHESELIKNQVLDLISFQGKYLEESSTKKSSLDIKL
ncbi:MAG: DUF5610 domain-containing protein [Fusobacteria bacterium]|nr:DUF5610 domain-containing protein [Fusobacteriota bacterium]